MVVVPGTVSVPLLLLDRTFLCSTPYQLTYVFLALAALLHTSAEKLLFGVIAWSRWLTHSALATAAFFLPFPLDLFLHLDLPGIDSLFLPFAMIFLAITILLIWTFKAAVSKHWPRLESSVALLSPAPYLFTAVAFPFGCL